MDTVAHACGLVWKTEAGRLIWPRSLRVAWGTLLVSILKKKNKGGGERGIKGREKEKREGRRKGTNGGGQNRGSNEGFIFFVGTAIVDYRRNFHQGCIK